MDLRIRGGEGGAAPAKSLIYKRRREGGAGGAAIAKSLISKRSLAEKRNPHTPLRAALARRSRRAVLS